MKRNIKFDEDSLGMMLDVQMNDHLPWRWIFPEEARSAGLVNSALRSGPDRLTAAELSSLAGRNGSRSEDPATGANSVPLG